MSEPSPSGLLTLLLSISVFVSTRKLFQPFHDGHLTNMHLLVPVKETTVSYTTAGIRLALPSIRVV